MSRNVRKDNNLFSVLDTGSSTNGTNTAEIIYVTEETTTASEGK